jgi:hypothetical protein
LTAVLVSRELFVATRIAGAFESSGRELRRLDEPSQLIGLEGGVSLLLVDWDQREPGWAKDLTTWLERYEGAEAPRVILFGPHADLAAHAAAKVSGLGPMWARSKLFAEIGRLAEVADPERPIRPGR